MRRFFSISFIALALVVGAAGAAPAAHAAGTIENNGGCFENSDCASNYCSPENLCQKDASVKSSNTYAPSTAGANQSTDPKLGGTAEEGFSKVMIWIMSLFAWLVGVAALTLDYAVFYTVVTMGAYVKDLSAIGVTWSILRDIGNIIIIFGFLAIGITTILNVDWYGGGKKMLPMLLISAVFLNFSLFLTGAVIDTGNLFATQFYTQIKGGQLPTAESLNKTTILDAVEKEGISNKIMGQLGLQTIYTAGRVNPDVYKAGNSWLIGFMGIILFVVTAFVMFSLAFILIARFVILLFLIIISPIGFAGLAVPQLKKMASEWWGKLFEQAITAPVLLLLLYIALRVITDVRFLTGLCTPSASSGSGVCTKNWLGFVEGNDLTGFASLILSFLIAMGLLSAVVIMSKRLSAFGGASVMKFGKSAASGAAKFAGRGALGAGRWGVNRSVGRGLHAASQGVMRNYGDTQLGRLTATALGAGGKGFKEAKEKSAKKHEEYRDNIAKALEEKHAPAIVAAMQDKATEQANVDAIRTKHATEDKPLIDEVKRLEKIVSDNEVSGKKGFDVMVAKDNLIKAKRDLSTQQDTKKSGRDAQIKNAKFGLTAAEEREKAATEVLAAAKRKAAVAYGESARTALNENPLTWVMSGPGGSKAGNKIIQDTLKKMSASEEAFDKLKKAITAEAKAAGKSAETSEKLNKAKEELKEKTEKEAEPKKP